MRDTAEMTALPRHQELLLLSGFAPAETARTAWSALSAELDLDTLVGEAHALLPALADRLRSLGIDYADLPRIDGVRRRTWYRNSRRLHEVAAAWRELSGAGVRPLVTGGLGVLLLQPDLGLRQLEEADLAVAAADAVHAQEVLRAAGWHQVTRRRDGFLLDLSAVVFTREGGSVTLRWAGTDALLPGISEPTTAAFAETEFEVAPSETLLTFALVDTLRLPGFTPIRMYGDALLLQSAEPPVDWELFLRRVRERNATLVVRNAVHYLADVLQAPVPVHALDRLDAEVVGWRDTLALRVSGVSDMAAAYLRRTSRTSALRSVRELPSFARDVWELDPGANTGAAALGRVQRRLRRLA